MVDQQQRSPKLASLAKVAAKTNLALASMQNAEVMDLLDGEDLRDCASTLDEEEGLVGIDVRGKAKWLSEVFEKREEAPKPSSATLLLPGKFVANRLKWLGETNTKPSQDDEPTEETDGSKEVAEREIGSCQPVGTVERTNCDEHTQKTTAQPSEKLNLENQKTDPIEEQLAWLEDEQRKMEDTNPAKKLISEHIAWLQSMKEEWSEEEPDLEEEEWFGKQGVVNRRNLTRDIPFL